MQVPAEAVELSDDEGVAVAECSEARGETRSVVEVGAVDAGGEKRVALQLEPGGEVDHLPQVIPDLLWVHWSIGTSLTASGRRGSA